MANIKIEHTGEGRDSRKVTEAIEFLSAYINGIRSGGHSFVLEYKAVDDGEKLLTIKTVKEPPAKQVEPPVDVAKAVPAQAVSVSPAPIVPSSPEKSA